MDMLVTNIRGYRDVGDILITILDFADKNIC